MSLRRTAEGWSTRTSSGGLASALSGVQQAEDLAWVGWPGAAVDEPHRAAVEADLARHDLVPVFLDEREQRDYYDGIGNRVLWPLFHYFADKVAFGKDAWSCYVEVNRRFANRIVEVCKPGGRVWVHDFHLMLVPQMLREMRPDLEIGFFLHIPFPSSEIYRLLPSREELLRGVLGADHIGFHIHDYARHFRSTALRVLGAESGHDWVMHEGRRISVGVHPIGVDVANFDRLLGDDATAAQLGDLRRRYAGRKLLLGIERLDYTKGVKLKLEAFERYLELHPEQVGKVTLLQVVVPSRLSHPDYRELKSELEQDVGRINGRWGVPGSTPVEYLHRNLTPEQLVALYRVADACLVTPVRDGMNLVAQEFVLCQGEHEHADAPHRGILILSEFAGAAQVLPRALLTNPWDLDKTVEAIDQAVSMSGTEKAERMAPMAEQVRAMDCRAWADGFLAKLGQAAETNRRQVRSVDLVGDDESWVRARYRDSEQRILLLDYDGTLRELVRTPQEAEPTDEILGLLEELAKDPRNEVHLVSGRHRRDLETWFGHLPIHLAAEHGFATRAPGRAWIETLDTDLGWLRTVETILAEVVEEVAGTTIERKPCSMAWHYRLADVDYGLWRARELHSQLEQDLAHLPVDILHGHKVVEIRSDGVHKGTYVRRATRDVDKATFVLCIGDDRTDLDMYRALPPHAITVHVGDHIDEARFTIASPPAVRRFLGSLLDVRALVGT